MGKKHKCIYCGKKKEMPVTDEDDIMKTAEDLEIHGLTDGESYIENNGGRGDAVCVECERNNVEYY